MRWKTKNICVLLFLFLIPVGNTISANSDCSSVNLFLDPQWGKAVLASEKSNLWRGYTKQMPVYDQGRAGICYAYTAAQMVDYWRITKGTRVTKNINLSTPL